MKGRTRTSPIWKPIKEEFIAIIEKSNSIGEALDHFNLENKGANYKTLVRRAEVEEISLVELKKRAREKQLKNLAFRSKRPLSEYCVEGGPEIGSSKLKKRLLDKDLLENKCNLCGQLPFHNDKVLNLQLDHINGNSKDNRLENLRILCPNCHTQTDTFCGRSAKGEKRAKKPICIDCDKEVSKEGKRCRVCSRKQQHSKINWPPIEELKLMLKESNYTQVGKALGVSDNAVRKHLNKTI